MRTWLVVFWMGLLAARVAAQDVPTAGDTVQDAATEATASPAAQDVEAPPTAPRAEVAPPPHVETERAAPPTVQTARANAWVAFEQGQEQGRQKGERLFYPLFLGLEAGLGAAVTAADQPLGARLSMGIGSGLAAAAIIPTILSSRDRSRMWFALGSAAVGLGLAGSFIGSDVGHRHSDTYLVHGGGIFTGAAIAVQALAMLPIAFIPGYPGDSDYEAYWKLPESARGDAAARILHQIDKFEQRVAAVTLLGNLVAASTFAAGIIAVHDRQDRRDMAGLALVPLTTALLLIVPRLFFDSRVDRYATGRAPQRMGFNVW